jgi:hypothetical protein
MGIASIREQLHQQIDTLPDDLIQFVADFIAFIIARRQKSVSYVDWERQEWQDFGLGQFLREDDEVEYSLDDAQEIFHE